MRNITRLTCWLCFVLLGAFSPAGVAPAPTLKIIGGKNAKAGAWPWMTALVFRGSDAFLGQFCGGTLVAPDWVLTAAHCVHKLTPAQLDALVGRTDLDATDGERIAVIEIVIHPNFNPGPLYDNDIALLKLQHPAAVAPVQTLDHFSVQDDPGETAIVLGWGALSGASPPFFPTILQQVPIPIAAPEQCGFDIIDTMLCAGYKGSDRDTCAGDSGGPLLVFDTESGIWRQAGITSFGFGPCGTVGIYTRLEQFKTFISDTLCRPEEKPQTPELSLSVADGIATATWTQAPNDEGYRLNYAPYPELNPIYSLDMNQAREISVALQPGDAFFVAISAYKDNCRSQFSTVEHFTVP
ncbi:MAG: hypothetical protein CVV13_04815 [Gammaproteobacteria bacterium HGW-Gammaproteobacteria-3]|nr:MAG: hypothetical protein CVV13_04815 [Gammaproteobacteria bacterium HGW-Gammaproteobacteria-3]